ncbi:M16 family metallopeptidase [Novipirellula artificiosorum]|uniref:Protease 3 n=1 Tax=Novipirellula artificiosorum TaxID=2528016 RepID=A0A5C6DU73_9BACT|nr:pitrilysin family protein [Novipirellula artificiosorum]TWU40923.1 Protease 3 precursor [Novipirellula artificiosorum]
MTHFQTYTLSNGLRVAAEIDHRCYSAAMGYFVRAGAKDETDRESGLSHFLEHMMFKGTDRRTAADVNRELDELGGNSNAYTSEEQTVYYATVLPKFQDRLVDLLTDMLSPKLDEHEFETERKVILEEIAKYEDQPPFGAFERVMEIYYGPRGLGRRVLGTKESIEATDATSMRNYFHRRYRPEQMVFAATGNVDFERLIETLERQTASWHQRPLPEPPTADDMQSLPAGIALDSHLEIEDAAQAYCVRISRGPSMASEDRYATRILASILGDEGGSRLFWELIDTGRAETATVWPQEFADSGAWFSYLVCERSELESNSKLMQELLMRTADEGVTAEELQQATNKATAACIMQSERPSNRLFSVGSRWLTYGQYVSTDDLLNQFRAIDLTAVSKAANAYLNESSTEVVAAASQVQQLS